MNNTDFPVAFTDHQLFSHHTAKLHDSKNILLVLLILQNLKINTIIMPLIVSFLIILLKTELPWMLLLQSLYENDELRSAE